MGKRKENKAYTQDLKEKVAIYDFKESSKMVQKVEMDNVANAIFVDA